MTIFGLFLLIEGGILCLRFRNGKYILCAVLVNAVTLPCILALFVLTLMFFDGIGLILCLLISPVLIGTLMKLGLYRFLMGKNSRPMPLVMAAVHFGLALLMVGVVALL